MAFITPDLESIFGSYQQPQPAPVPTDPTQVADLVKKLSGSSDQALLAELVRQGMTKGLDVTANSAHPEGALGFTQQGTGAVGYGGPLRPSDVPSSGRVGELMKPEQAADVGREEVLRRQPFGQTGKSVGDVMDLLGITKGASKEAQYGVMEQAIPGSMSAYKNLVNDQKMSDYAERRKIARENAPAPAGLYLDKEGQPYAPALGADIQEGSTHYRANSPQQKIYGASGMINTHVDRTLEELKGIQAKDTNRFSQYLNTEMRRLKGNPEVATLVDLLGPATALALNGAYAASGGSLRMSVQGAKMFEHGVYSEGDKLKTTLHKLKTIEEINLDNAKNFNLHPRVQQEIKNRINLIDEISSGKAPLPGQQAPTAPTAQAAPQGDQQVGTQKSTGKPVFQRPDGSYYTR